MIMITREYAEQGSVFPEKKKQHKKTADRVSVVKTFTVDSSEGLIICSKYGKDLAG